MDIYAKRGTKIKYCNPNNGHPADQEVGKKYLKLDEVYTVHHRQVYSFHSKVYLNEIGEGAVPFNSVLFDDVKEKKMRKKVS